MGGCRGGFWTAQRGCGGAACPLSRALFFMVCTPLHPIPPELRRFGRNHESQSAATIRTMCGRCRAPRWGRSRIKRKPSAAARLNAPCTVRLQTPAMAAMASIGREHCPCSETSCATTDKAARWPSEKALRIRSGNRPSPPRDRLRACAAALCVSSRTRREKAKGERLAKACDTAGLRAGRAASASQRCHMAAAAAGSCRDLAKSCRSSRAERFPAVWISSARGPGFIGKPALMLAESHPRPALPSG